MKIQIVLLIFGFMVFCGCESDSLPTTQQQPITSNIATLSSLTTSITNYPNAFTSELFSYSTAVFRPTDTLLIRATATDTSATVRIHDPEFIGQSFRLKPQETYGPANLSLGANIFVVEVIASDLSATILYTLSIQRLPQDSIAP